MNVLKTYNEFHTSHFDLRVDHYGAEICDSSYSFGPAVRENYVLHFIVDGKGSFSVNGKTVELGPGDLFILPQNVETYYQANETEPWTYLWVGFSGSRASRILNRSTLLDQYYLHSSLTSNILNRMMKIISFADKPLNFSTDLQLLGELSYLLSELLNEFPKEMKSKEEQAHLYVRQTMSIIHQQYSSSIKVNDISKILNLNRSYLFKIFKDYTGYSIKDYIVKVKMDRAAHLLKQSDLSISSVSNSVGYQDSFSFSKAFKNYFSLSPSQYRKQHKLSN